LPPPQPAGLGESPPPLPQQFEAKVENTFFTRPLPHLAQALPWSSPLFPALYRSKASPQESHRYSYIGIFTLLYALKSQTSNLTSGVFQP
jgi:hypothetical protein